MSHSPIPPDSSHAQPGMHSADVDSPADEEWEEEVEGGGGRFILFNAVPSWLVSMVVHAILLVVLAVWTVGGVDPEKKRELVIGPNPDNEQIEELEIEPTIEPLDPTEVAENIESDLVVQEEVTDPVEQITVLDNPTSIETGQIAVDVQDFGEQAAPRSDMLASVGAVTGDSPFSGRSSAKGKIAIEAGGTKGSEAAVAAGLKWLAEHQYPDGGWSFDHTRGACQGRCGDPGALADARNGATAIALLPFLGSGHTHLEGDYKNNVKAGLAYLVRNMKARDGGGSFHEGGGRMYSHGLAAICLCEAYAMTHDKGLMGPAQASLNFIVAAQDPVGGGWRYEPRQAGDTSAVGWQIMALKSGHMGYLQVPPNTVRGAIKFLDSVQSNSGASYGYTNPGSGPATTAVGLLCRMYLGWNHENPALQRGVEALASRGPSKDDMYFNYYATQVMRHYEGEPWNTWNPKMRDHLVNSQIKSGHQTGSWHFNGGHGAKQGGRLYNTAMATMILEVYYRHLPIYQKAAAEEEFPL